MTLQALWFSPDSCYSIPRCATLSSLIQFPVKAFTRISPLYEVLPSTRVTLMTIYTTVTNRHIRNIIMIVLCMYCKAWKKLYKWFLCQHIKCVFKSPDCIWEWWFLCRRFPLSLYNLPARKISTVGCTWPTCDRAPLLDTGGMMSNERVIHLSSLPSNNLISVILQQFRTLWFCLVVTTKLWWRPSFCRAQWFTLRKWWSLQLCRVVYLVLPDFLTPLVSSLSSHFRWLLYKDVFFCSLIMCLIWTFPFKWNVSKLWKGVCLSFHGKQKLCYSF